MAREFCPKCGTERNLEVAVSRRKEADDKGNIREVTIRTYHCEVCHSFVRSERSGADVHAPAGG